MFISTVALTASSGRIGDAVVYLRNLREAAEAATGSRARIHTSMLGAPGHFIVTAEYPTVEAWNAAREKLNGDATVQKMIAEAGKSGLWAQGSVTRGVWEEL